MIIRISSKFRKAYKKLPKEIQKRAQEKEEIFRGDPFDSRLDTHKLHGKYKDYWAFTISGQWRIMCAFAGKDTADFVNVGTHRIYQ